MARNIYFSEQVRSEQSLYEDIVIEALKIYGYDMYYLPRDIVNRDDLLNEDVSSRFNSAYMIEMYVDNIEGFDGQGDIFQKFGVEIRDNVTLTMSRRRWNQAIKRHDNELTSERPLEGDLVYVPFSRKLFQIMRVEHEQPFYQINNLPTFKLYCELYEFAGDDFDTEVTVIDQIERSYAYKYIISFTGGTNATAVATLDSDDRVAYYLMTNVGSGYTGNPVITISDPDQEPRTASIRVLTDSNTITSVEITDSGNYYTELPSLTGLITPANEFSKFGSSSLRMDSVGQTALGYYVGEGQEFNTTNNRFVMRWFAWVESSNEEYQALAGFDYTPLENGVEGERNTVTLMHRTSDNKTLLLNDDIATATVPNNTPLIVSKPGSTNLDSGFWNYIEIHFLNNAVKVNINGDSGGIFTNNAVPEFSFKEGHEFTFGAMRNLYPDKEVYNGYVGYVDQFVMIKSGDTEFRLANPIPTTVVQTERDDDTLIKGFVIENYDHTVPTFVATIQSGRITSVIADVPGTGLRTAEYNITLPAPAGTAKDFVAVAEPVIEGGQIVRLNTINGGSGYSTPPTVTIAPQGANVVFEANDKVYQTLSDGTVLEGDVIKFSDSDYRIHIVNVQSSDGKYHEFATNALLHKDSVNSSVAAYVISVEEVNQLSENEQNDTFSTEAATFLDFSETNPFGNPENN